jgi:hypothetical protein
LKSFEGPWSSESVSTRKAHDFALLHEPFGRRRIDPRETPATLYSKLSRSSAALWLTRQTGQAVYLTQGEAGMRFAATRPRTADRD